MALKYAMPRERSGPIANAVIRTLKNRFSSGFRLDFS